MNPEEKYVVESERYNSTTRKSGWLHFKKWLINTRGKLELASKRNWKKYWVSFRKQNLYFYEVEGTEIDENTSPKLSIATEGCLVQSLPEYPRKENIFCMSTQTGHVYLFQAQSQNEIDHWMRTIHNSCAYFVAKTTKKESVISAINKECHRIEKDIQNQSKMKMMADLQLKSTSEPKSREAVLKQIVHWDKDLEKLNIDLYRLKCYLSSINSNETPNPKNLLAQASKVSKSALTKLEAFTVCALHANNVPLKPKESLATTATLPNGTESGSGVVRASFKNNLVNLYTPRSENGKHLPMKSNTFSRHSKFASSLKFTFNKASVECVSRNGLMRENKNFAVSYSPQISEEKDADTTVINEFTPLVCETRMIEILLPNDEVNFQYLVLIKLF